MSNIAPSSHHKPLLAALAGEARPRPPFWLMRQAGRYLPEYRAVRAKAGSFLDLCYDPVLATEVTLQPLRRFGMDAAILFSDILVVPDGLGQPVRFMEGEGPRLDPITDTAGLRRLDPNRLRRHLAPVYETVGRIRAALDPSVALIGFAGAPWTVACYMVEGGASKEYAAVKGWSLRDRAGFDALIDRLVAATIDHLDAQIMAGVEVVQLFDSWAGALSADGFRHHVIGPTRRIVAALKERHPGVPIIGFPRGAGVLYPDYARETGVDAVSLDTAVPPDWAARAVQTLKPVQGNLDPIALMVGGVALEQAACRILDALAGGPFVFNLGHGIVQATPPDHVAALAGLLRRWPDR